MQWKNQLQHFQQQQQQPDNETLLRFQSVTARFLQLKHINAIAHCISFG